MSAGLTSGGPDLLRVAAHGTMAGGRCPDCGHVSWAVQSHCRYRLWNRSDDAVIRPGATETGQQWLARISHRGVQPARFEGGSELIGWN